MIVKGRKMYICVEYLIVQVIIFAVIPTTFLSRDGWRRSVGVYSIQRVVEHLQAEFPDRRVVKKQQQHLGQSELFLQTFYCLPQTFKPSISIYINISCPKTSSKTFLQNIN